MEQDGWKGSDCWELKCHGAHKRDQPHANKDTEIIFPWWILLVFCEWARLELMAPPLWGACATERLREIPPYYLSVSFWSACTNRTSSNCDLPTTGPSRCRHMSDSLTHIYALVLETSTLQRHWLHYKFTLIQSCFYLNVIFACILNRIITEYKLWRIPIRNQPICCQKKWEKYGFNLLMHFR